jgi:hypothetical protein
MPCPGRSGISSWPSFSANGSRRIGIGPILPFEPVRGLGDAHQVGGDLGVQVGRHRNAGGARDRRGAQPSGHAADPHQVGHHAVAGAGLHRVEELARAVEVLAELDRRLQLARQLRMAGMLS